MADPTAKTFTISPKGYAAWAFGGAGVDSNITFSSATCTNATGSSRKPSGTATAPPPSYILGGECSRFWVHSGYPTDPR